MDQFKRCNYGVRNRKNFAGVDVLIGMAFEKSPLASKFPTEFVVQRPIGVVKFVVVSQVYWPLAVPPLPVRMRLPPETTGGLTTGGVGTEI
jgi:hypothetical protein